MRSQETPDCVTHDVTINSGLDMSEDKPKRISLLKLARTMSMSSNSSHTRDTSPEVERHPKKRRRTLDTCKQVHDMQDVHHNIDVTSSPMIRTLGDIDSTIGGDIYEHLVNSEYSLPSTSGGKRKGNTQQKVSSHTLDWIQNYNPLLLDIYQNDLSRDSSVSVYATAGSSRTESPELSRRKESGHAPYCADSSSDLGEWNDGVILFK